MSEQVTAKAYCKSCGRFTTHRVDAGRLGPCMVCVASTAGELTFEPSAVEVAQQSGLFDAAAPAAETKVDVCETISAPVETVSSVPVSMAETEASALVTRAFVQACHDAQLDYRGYGIEGGDRVYDYSRRGAPAVVFRLRVSEWDRTPAMLEREARKLERWLV